MARRTALALCEPRLSMMTMSRAAGSGPEPSRCREGRLLTDMPRPRPPFLSREVTRHGRSVWYVRRDGKRIRLRAEYGTPEFTAEYQAVLAAHQPVPEVTIAAGTLAWLIEC